MLAVSNCCLKEQDSSNISVFIFYIFKWCYSFNKKEMSYEECVCGMMMIMLMMMMMQKKSNSNFCDKYINNNNNNNTFVEQFRARKMHMFITEY